MKETALSVLTVLCEFNVSPVASAGTRRVHRSPAVLYNCYPEPSGCQGSRWRNSSFFVSCLPAQRRG